MIRIIIYLIIYFLLIVSSCFAQIKSEEILIKNNDIELPGTLSYTTEKQPLIIWVHGSGNIDRNGNQTPMIKANYIKQFRDVIIKNNIAFFSYDKRTANSKNIKTLKKGILFDDYIADINAVINHFKKNKNFNQIILIGHSQGSLTAMLALQNIDKYISLAGTSENIDKTIIKQLTNQNPFAATIAEAHFKELKETGSIENINPMLATIFPKQNLSFLKNWMSYNPTEEIKKVTIPTLIINGDKDLQVPIKNAKELHNANKNSTLVIIKNMNHVLKEIKKEEDNQKSYLSAKYPISKELIAVIKDFILSSK